MIRYILQRIVMLIPIMLAVTFVVFFIIDLAPGDAVDVLATNEMTVEQKEAMRESMGLNDPLMVRYFRYVGNFLKGDMGVSYFSGKGVFEICMARLPNTIILALAGIFIAIVVAIPLGLLAAVKQNTWIDTLSMAVGLFGVSMPNFWLGLLLILAFALRLGWFPSFGNTDGLLSLVLPAICVSAGQAALIMRITRSSMLEVIRQDYLRTARAKGVRENMVIRKHALKNALIPIITVIGTQLGVTLGGAVMAESVFAWPGLGRMVVDAIGQRDIPVVTGGIILATMLSSILMLIIDIAYAFIDPRIKARYAG